MKNKGRDNKKMKKIKTIMIQVRTSDEEEWETIGAKGIRYTEFTQAIREYSFEDFYNAIYNKRYYNWEHTFFTTRTNWLTRVRRVVCLTKNIEMTEKSCSKIYIKEIALTQDISNTSLKTLQEVLPAKDFIEFIKDNWKEEIDIT